MAECSYTSQKVEVIEQEKFTLELSREEAQVLRRVLAAVSFSGQTSKFHRTIARALDSADSDLYGQAENKFRITKGQWGVSVSVRD